MSMTTGESERLAEWSRAVRESSIKRLMRVLEPLITWRPTPDAMSFVHHRGQLAAYFRVVGSMHARKALMADLADGFIALPGGWGTLEEFFEVLTWAQLGLHQKPCGLLNVRGFFDGLLSFIDHSIDERFVRRENRSMVLVSSSPGTLLELFDRYVPPVVEKWIDDAST